MEKQKARAQQRLAKKGPPKTNDDENFQQIHCP